MKPTVAIIGTAGRDRSKPLNSTLWHWMLDDARSRIRKGARLMSGGAAWADHIAVALFLEGHASELILHLPAPINERGWFEGPQKSSGSAANFYHGLFGACLNKSTIGEILLASRMDNCHGTVQPVRAGYGGLFARNALVAQADQMLAYTFGTGDAPGDGGTKDTWDKCQGTKLHVPLPWI